MKVKVKICGLTNLEDTLDAIELGADYLGFNFYRDSKRYVSPEMFAEIVREVPYEIAKVGVFVNADPQFVIDISTEFELDLLQFHGDEKPEYCNQFARPFIRAIRPERESDLEGLHLYDADYFLVDSFVSSSYGGTGVVSNWDLARIARKESGKPIFLSGGLTADNVEIAIGSVRPFAIDVASGVEEHPGKKSYRKMEEFIKRAKSVIS